MGQLFLFLRQWLRGHLCSDSIKEIDILQVHHVVEVLFIFLDSCEKSHGLWVWVKWSNWALFVDLAVKGLIAGLVKCLDHDLKIVLYF